MPIRCKIGLEGYRRITGVLTWPIQARCWLEWGSSTSGQTLPAALSCFRAVCSDSIATVPQPVAQWMSLQHPHSKISQRTRNRGALRFPVAAATRQKNAAHGVSRGSQRTGDGWTGGPFKPGVGLSGAVLPLDKPSPPLVRVFVPSIPTRSPPVPHSRSRSGENCPTPSLPDVRTTRA